MAVMILAQVIQVRLAGNAPHLDVVYVITTAVRMGLRSLITALRTYPLDALIAFAIPAGTAYFLAPPLDSDMQHRIVLNAWITIVAAAISVVLLVYFRQCACLLRNAQRSPQSAQR